MRPTVIPRESVITIAEFRVKAAVDTICSRMPAVLGIVLTVTEVSIRLYKASHCPLNRVRSVSLSNSDVKY